MTHLLRASLFLNWVFTLLLLFALMETKHHLIQVQKELVALQRDVSTLAEASMNNSKAIHQNSESIIGLVELRRDVLSGRPLTLPVCRLGEALTNDLGASSMHCAPTK